MEKTITCGQFMIHSFTTDFTMVNVAVKYLCFLIVEQKLLSMFIALRFLEPSLNLQAAVDFDTPKLVDN